VLSSKRLSSQKAILSPESLRGCPVEHPPSRPRLPMAGQHRRTSRTEPQNVTTHQVLPERDIQTGEAAGLLRGRETCPRYGGRSQRETTAGNACLQLGRGLRHTSPNSRTRFNDLRNGSLRWDYGAATFVGFGGRTTKTARFVSRSRYGKTRYGAQDTPEQGSGSGQSATCKDARRASSSLRESRIGANLHRNERQVCEHEQRPEPNNQASS